PGQAAVMLDEAGRAALLQTSLAGDQPATSLAAIQDVLDEDDEEEDDDDELPPDDGSTPRDLPLWATWEEMTKPDRIKLARYGHADARRLVLKDRDPMLHRMVLNNPGLTPTALVALLKGGAASSSFVRAVTERNDLVGNI